MGGKHCLQNELNANDMKAKKQTKNTNNIMKVLKIVTAKVWKSERRQ